MAYYPIVFSSSLPLPDLPFNLSILHLTTIQQCLLLDAFMKQSFITHSGREKLKRYINK